MKLIDSANQFHIDQPDQLPELSATSLTASEISQLVSYVTIEVQADIEIRALCESALKLKILAPEYLDITGLRPEHIQSKAADARVDDRLWILGYGELIFPGHVKQAFDLNEIWDLWWARLEGNVQSIVNYPGSILLFLMTLFPQHRDRLVVHMERVDKTISYISKCLGDGDNISHHLPSLIMIAILDRSRLAHLQLDPSLKSLATQELEEKRQTPGYQKIMGCAVLLKLLAADQVSFSEYGIDVSDPIETGLPGIIIY